MKKPFFTLLILSAQFLEAANYTVTNSDDSSTTPGCFRYILQQIIVENDTAPVITFDSGISINLSTDLPVVSSGQGSGTVTINGNGATINGQNAYQALFVSALTSGGTLTASINDLNLVNCMNVGGIGGSGNTFCGGGAAGAGGGLFIDTGSTVTISGVAFSNCAAVGGAGGSFGSGGGGSGGGAGYRRGSGGAASLSSSTQGDDPIYNGSYGGGGGGGFGSAGGTSIYSGGGGGGGAWTANSTYGGNAGNSESDLDNIGGAGGGGGTLSAGANGTNGTFSILTEYTAGGNGGDGISGSGGGGSSSASSGGNGTSGGGGGGGAGWDFDIIEPSTLTATGGDGSFGGGGGGGPGYYSPVYNNSGGAGGAGGKFGGGGGGGESDTEETPYTPGSGGAGGDFAGGGGGAINYWQAYQCYLAVTGQGGSCDKPNPWGNGGNGGDFGGGGGGSTGGNSGFGGGGGGGFTPGTSSAEGGQGGTSQSGYPQMAAGGGGAGLGGAIFVRTGGSLSIEGGCSFSGSSVTGGSGGTTPDELASAGGGTARGQDLYLQTATLDVAENVTTTGTIALPAANPNFTKTGAGTLTFAAPTNDYAGDTTISAGTISFSNANQFGGGGTITIASGASLTANTTVSLADNIVLNATSPYSFIETPGGSTFTLSGVLSGGAINVNGSTASPDPAPGTIYLTNPSNTFANVVITAGTLQLGGSTVLGNSTSLDLGVGNGYAAILQAAAPNITLPSSLNIYPVGQAYINTNGYTMTILSPILGSGTTIKSGAGTLILDNPGATPSDFTTMQVNQGTLQINTLTSMPGSVLLYNNGTSIAFNLSASGTYDGEISDEGASGSGSLLQIGSGSSANLTLGNANNPYTGGTTISGSGLLSISSPNSLGTGTVTFANSNTTLQLAGTFTFANNIAVASGQTGSIDTTSGMSPTLTGNITGGTLNQIDTGTLILGMTGSNTFNGNLSINGGGVQIDTTGGVPTGSIVANGPLIFNLSSAYSYDEAISGTSYLSQTGTGILTLGGNNSYQGQTNVGANSTLGISAISALPSLGGATIGSGGTLNFSLSATAGGTYIGNITGAGALVQAGTPLTLTGSNSYTGGTIINSGATLQINGTSALPTGSASPNVNVMSAAALEFITSLTYDGTIGGAGGVTLSGASTNVTLSNTGNTYTGPTTIESSAILTVTATGQIPTASDTVLMSNGALDLAGTGGTYSSSISGNGSVAILSGAGTWILTGSNTYSGSTTIPSGTTLSISQNGALSAYSTIIDNGTLNFEGGGTISYGGNIGGVGALTISTSNTVLNLSGTNSYTGGTALAAGTTLNIGASGALANGTVALSSTAALVFTGGVGTFGGQISGAGTVATSGAGTSWTLNGTNTYTGGTTIGTNSQLTIASPTALPASEPVTDNGTLVLSGNGTTITGNITGSGSLQTVGSGTWSLEGGNTYSNGTIVGDGTNISTLTILSAFALPGDAVVNANSILNFDLGAAISYVGIISGSGSVSQIGDSISLFGTNTYTGGTNIAAGATISVVAGGALPSTGLITLNGTLDISNISAPSSTVGNISGSSTGTLAIGSKQIILGNSTNQVFQGQITGTSTGSLYKQGNGSLTLSGINTYGGGTTIADGTLFLGGSGTLSTTGAVTVSSGATFDLTGSSLTSITIGDYSGGGTTNLGNVQLTFGTANSLTYSGLIQDSTGASLVKQGSGTQTLTNNANNYTGGTTINSGTLNITSDSVLGISSAPLTINGGTLQTSGNIFSVRPYIIGTSGGTINTTQSTNAPGALYIQRGLSDLGGDLTLIGSGVVYLYNENSFNQTVNVNSGTLALSNAGTSPCTLLGSVVIALGATLTGNGSVGSLTNSGTISPGASLGVITVNGPLTLNPTSTLKIEVTPTGSDLIAVTGPASIGGVLNVTFLTGNYSVSDTWTIITSSGASGAFSSIIPNAVPSGFPTPNVTLNVPAVGDVTLTFAPGQDPPPISGTPIILPPIGNIGNIINEKAVAGDLIKNPELYNYVRAINKQSTEVINFALLLLSPSLFSSASDIQAFLGAQVVDLLHHWPYHGCVPYQPTRVWVEPFGNWYNVKSIDSQFGFTTLSEGIVAGVDRVIGSNWILGVAGAFNVAKVKWPVPGDKAHVNTYYGAAYADFMGEHTHIGFTLLGGSDRYDMSRVIDYAGTNAAALSRHNGMEWVGNVQGFLDFPLEHSTVVSPFVNLSYFYLHMSEFSERNAGGLDLTVEQINTQTARGEIGVSGQKRRPFANCKGCVEVSGNVSYVVQSPVKRPAIDAHFSDEPTFPFEVPEWDHLWQFFSPSATVQMDYNNASLSVLYKAEFGNKYFGQKADVRFDWRW